MAKSLPIVLPLAIFFSNCKADVCASFNDSKRFQKALEFSKDVCYFIPHNATRESNKRLRDEPPRTWPPDPRNYHKFRFDIEKARSICRRFDASLPITKNEDEIAFILQRFLAIDFDPEWFTETEYGLDASVVALGIQVPNCMLNRKWDDGADISDYYDPIMWSYRALNATNCRYAVLLDPKFATDEAALVPDEFYFAYPTRVLCRFEPPGLAASKRRIAAMSAAATAPVHIQLSSCMLAILLAIIAAM